MLRSSRSEGSESPLTTTVGGGGVASRTGPPVCFGTCSESLCGRLEVALCGGCISGAIESSVADLASWCDDGLPGLGLEENVKKRPSWIIRDVGGLPLGLPGAFCDDQALDTAGPCRRLLFADGVMADLGSSENAASI